jgi:hypothetical protein
VTLLRDHQHSRNDSRRQRVPRNDAAHRSLTGRPPPHSIEAEQFLLSCCLLDGGDLITRCLKSGVTADSFYIRNHAVIFDVALRLFGAGKTIGLAEVAEELKSDGVLDAVGGYPFLADVTARIPTTAQASYFIDKVRELALLRKTLRAAIETAESCYDFGGDIDAFCAEQEERILSVTRARVGVGAARGGALPRLMSWADLIGTATRVEPPQLVAGLIHRGGKVMLGGGSKSFKTWVLTDLALSIATGTPWWGMKTTQGRVLFVNFELQTWSFEARVRSICAAKKIPLDDAGLPNVPNFTSWHLRGFAADLAELIPQFLTQTVGSKYDVIILDPIYKCLGERDENANGEVAGLLNEVEALAVRSDAAVVFGHHFSKGNQAAKDARDRVSGAGAWTRDPDTVITLTPHEEEDCFTAEFVLRDLKPRAPLAVRWNHPCMELASGLDPSALRQPGRPNEHTVEALVELLRGEKWNYTEFERAAVKRKKMSESTFKRKLGEAVEGGRIVRMANIYSVKEDSP